jgi:addiction module HigA family antidote
LQFEKPFFSYRVTFSHKNKKYKQVSFCRYYTYIKKGEYMQKYIELEKVGTIICEEFFEPYRVSIDVVSTATTIPNWDLAAIIYGDKQISAEIDLLLTKYFGLSQGYFLRMQDTYNMRLAKQKLRGN